MGFVIFTFLLIVIFLHKIIFVVFIAGRLSLPAIRVGLPCGFFNIVCKEIFKTRFAKVQNKMHYAVHGHTAAELIYERADADKPHMGLTTLWQPHRKARS